MYTELVSLPEHICEQVFERDGKKCWLCGSEAALQIAHQIDCGMNTFHRFQANGTIPSSVTSPSHADNLFPLCAKCHRGHDLEFPEWVLIPDEETLHKYIDHEKIDYENRYLVSQESKTVGIPTRFLPFIDRNKILYHPLLLLASQTSPDFYLHRYGTHWHWPKSWLGEPTTVIHQAACRGLFTSTPTRPLNLGRDRKWQPGVPRIFRRLVAELIGLWARKPLTRSLRRNKGV